MKKKLTTVTLLLATALSATGCDDDSVTYKETNDGESIVYSIKIGDNVDYYTADELLKDFQDNATAKSTIYSEISRQVFTKYGEGVLEESKLKSLKADASDDIDDFKQDCKDGASENSTDYDSYLEDALEAKGVSTLSELEDLYYYQGLKEELLEDYLEETNHYNYFLDKYLDAYTPFQVKHILVAANSSDSKYATGTMTTTNATKLLSVLRRFINGDTFESIAQITDDTSSADNGGVMPFNEAQNYVSEFRFATYVQEIFVNNETLDDRYAKAAELHIIDSEKTTKEEFQESDLYKAYENGVGYVSLEKIMALQNNVQADMAGAFNYYTTEGKLKDESGSLLKTVAEQPYSTDPYDENDDEYYEEYELQRNVIFNETLNNHKVQYIELGAYAETMTSNKTTVNGVEVLADDQGNPIFVAYASTGIHFMSMVWNSYNPLGNGYTSQKISQEALDSYKAILVAQGETIAEGATLTREQINRAYFTLFDDEADTASNYENYKYTYIGRNGAYETKSKLTSNSDSLLNSISSYVSNVEYYLFDALVYQQDSKLEEQNFTISFYDEGYAELIKDYVADNLGTTDEDFADSVVEAAETYAEKLARAQEVIDATKYLKRSV